MTREEYENAIKSVHGFDFENNVPVYDGDISIYQNFMDIKDEYIESLEKEVEKYKNMTSQEAYDLFIDKWCRELKND